MKAKRILQIVVITFFAVSCMYYLAGCVTGAANKQTGEIISLDDYNAMTPEQQQNFRVVKVLDPDTGDFISGAVKTTEPLVAAVSPYAGLLPYGTLVLGLVTGLLGAWKKLAPYITFTKETIAGLQALRDPDTGKLPTSVATVLNESQSNATKAFVATNLAANPVVSKPAA